MDMGMDLTKDSRRIEFNCAAVPLFRDELQALINLLDEQTDISPPLRFALNQFHNALAILDRP